MAIETLSNKQKPLQRRTSIENHESSKAMEDFCVGWLIWSPDEYRLNYYCFHLTQDEIMTSSKNNTLHRIALLRRTETNHWEVYCFEPEEVYTNKDEAKNSIQGKEEYIADEFEKSRIGFYTYIAKDEPIQITYWTYNDSIIGTIMETPKEIVTSRFATKDALDILRAAQMRWKTEWIGNTVAELITYLWNTVE